MNCYLSASLSRNHRTALKIISSAPPPRCTEGHVTFPMCPLHHHCIANPILAASIDTYTRWVNRCVTAIFYQLKTNRRILCETYYMNNIFANRRNSLLSHYLYMGFDSRFKWYNACDMPLVIPRSADSCYIRRFILREYLTHVHKSGARPYEDETPIRIFVQETRLG